MTREDLAEYADAFHSIKAQAEAIEIDDQASAAQAIHAWQQVAERLCLIDYLIGKAFPLMVWPENPVRH